MSSYWPALFRPSRLSAYRLRSSWNCRYSTSARRDQEAKSIEEDRTVPAPAVVEARLDNVFLRDACPCSECVSPSSKQKHFSTGQIPLDIHPSYMRPLKDGSTEIKWTSESLPAHVSVYSESQLRHFGSPVSRFDSRWKFAREEHLWNAGELKKSLVSRSYNDYLTDKEAFADVLLALYSDGLAFLTDAPTSENDAEGNVVVEKVAREIGYIKETFYGTSWDVIAVPDAKNIAYTSVNLPLHMDLLYYESPPGVQLLHCIQNDAEGGESIYVDSYRAAHLIYERDPEAFHALCTFPITFHYRNDGYHYMNTRPLIELDPFYTKPSAMHPDFRIKCVNYSPPFQAPFEHYVSSSDQELTDLTDQGRFRKFLRAFRQFEQTLFDKSEQYQTKFRPGEIALFMNRRVLHSRTEFKLSESTGRKRGRWLKGTYLDIDSFYSKLRMVSGL